MAYIFNITNTMQASIRLGTGIHPDTPSFGIFIGTPVPDTDEAPPKSALDVSAYDACEWECAVKLAKWILDMDAVLRDDNDQVQK